MPRRCTICDHTDRQTIDELLIAGESFRYVSKQFGTSTTALFRHKQDHIPARLAQAHRAQEFVQATALARQVQQQNQDAVDQADSLLERLLVLHQETLAILDEARTGNAKDNALALRAIARAEKQLELQARLLGELQDGASVNIAVSPQWHVLRATVLQALIPYPEARVAVAEALTHDTQHQLNGN